MHIIKAQLTLARHDRRCLHFSKKMFGLLLLSTRQVTTSVRQVELWKQMDRHSRKLVQPLCETLRRLLKTLRVESSYDSATPLLGIHPQHLKTFICKDTCTPMFIAAFFTVAKTWRQLQCPSRDDCIKKMSYVYTTEYYSAMRKDKTLLSVAT